MKKSRIIALLTAVAMIMSVVPALASGPVGGYFVDDEGVVYEKSGTNLISNPGFEEGLTGLTQNDEYYALSTDNVHSGSNSLKAIKSTKGEGAITAYFPVSDANASYYLSFWYLNTDEVARRPRVTFAFTDSSKVIPTEENDFTDATNAWIGAGTASNDQDMEYSKGEWVQYSTVLSGNGSAQACAYVALNIYGLTKDVAYVDDFELYCLTSSDDYSADFAKAVAEWEAKTMPKGPLAGFGTLNLPREVSVDGIGVKWFSSTDMVDAETGNYSSGAEEVLAILTARLYVEGLEEEIHFDYDYPYIVKNMFEPYFAWLEGGIFTEIGSSVSANVNLPKSHEIAGYYPAQITWECSDPALSSDGVFTAPEVTKFVDITATVTCNGVSQSISKRVKALGGNIVGDGLEMYYDFETKLNSKSELYDNAQKVYNADVENVVISGGTATLAGGTIILPSDYAKNLTGSYSVSMWIKVDSSIAGSASMYRFFDFGGGTYTSQFLRFIPSSSEIAFMDRGTADGGSDFAIQTTDAKGFADTWKLVSFTYDMTSSPALATLYVDGAKVADSGSYTKLTNSVSTVATVSSQTGFIGRTQWNNGENPDMRAQLDDVRIYSRAITSDEITTLYNETRPTVVAPVTIKYVDVDGNGLKSDVTVSADVGTTYNVPEALKSVSSYSDDRYRYIYKYLSSKSDDSVYVEDDGAVCTLVFQLVKEAKGTNLIANPSFEVNLDGWTYNNNGSFGALQGWVRSDENPYEGNYSLKKIASGGGTTNNNIGTYIPIEAGKKYTLSWWEHSSADKAAGSHQMMAAVVTSDNTSALGTTTNRIVACGGWDSWNSGAMGQATRDPAYVNGWTQRVFEFDTTQTPNAKYILIAYANGDATSVDYLDGFVLEEVGAGGGGEEEGEKIPVIIHYLDTEGNTLKDDVIEEVPVGTQTYTASDAMKKLEGYNDASLTVRYLYNEKLSTDTTSISMLRDNVITLVFDVAMADLNNEAANLVADGGFKGENGKFSWGTWQSPSTGQAFSAKCEDWFYQVDRDTNTSALFLTGVTADDYALGTRWNDGEKGLCSMANFIPVEKGKVYIVSYDYKHKSPTTAAKQYICTSFQKTKNMDPSGVNEDEGMNAPETVSADWQTNTFAIKAEEDGYIYFHFYYLGESNNGGSGPFWYFDNFKVMESDTFRNEVTYENGFVSILAEEGTTGYVVQAMYNEEGALTSVVVSEKYTFNEETPVVVPVTEGAKVMVVKDLQTIEPIAPAVKAE